MRQIDYKECFAKYEALLFDAYGVLMNGKGALPGAADALLWLNDQEIPWWVVTNGSSRTLTEAAAHYRKLGFSVADEQIISSGSLLAEWFLNSGLQGPNTVVLGTESSRQMVVDAGGEVVQLGDHFDVVVLADQSGFPFIETMDFLLSRICQQLDEGRKVKLVLTNPDLIYPKGNGTWGFTAGTMAQMLEGALKLRFGEDSPQFCRLGKPYAPIFREAYRRSGTMNMLMVGDQLETDMRGATAFGIDGALFLSGLSSFDLAGQSQYAPRWILKEW